MSRETCLAIERFLATLNAVDSQISKEPGLAKPERLFAQPIWKTLREYAASVITLSEAQPCRSGHQDIRAS